MSRRGSNRPVNAHPFPGIAERRQGNSMSATNSPPLPVCTQALPPWGAVGREQCPPGCVPWGNAGDPQGMFAQASRRQRKNTAWPDRRGGTATRMEDADAHWMKLA